MNDDDAMELSGRQAHYEQHADPDPVLALMSKAIDKGMSAGELGQLVELKLRLDADEARRRFFTAMNDCQREMQSIVREAYNPQTKSNYATLENVQRIAKPCYTRHGFSISAGTKDGAREGLIRIVVTVRHTRGHSEDYQFDLPPDNVGIQGAANKTLVHGAGSTFSYGVRYLLVQIFNINLLKEDTDGNAPVDLVTVDELAELDTLINQKNVSLPAFLKWASDAAGFEVETLDQFPRKVFAKALDMLKRKAAK